MIPIEIQNIFKGSKIQIFNPYFEEVKEYAELTNERRIAMYFAQCGIESAYFTKFEENLRYSAQRLADVFPSKYSVNKAAKIKVPNELAKSIAGKPELIGNSLYDYRMGNKKNQGFLFRGRGIIQLTGYFNYNAFNEDMGDYLSSDFIKFPDTVLYPRNSIYSSAWFWKNKKLNLFADKGDIRGATKIINGGLNAISERTNLYNKILKVI